MRATELRIRNLIQAYGEIAEITLIGTEGISAKYDGGNGKCTVKFSNPTLQPIPLTEEWLIKFGFTIHDKKYSLNYGGESMRFAILETKREPFVLFFHGKFGFNINEGRKNGDYCIETVHQLQNLFHALTGQELTTKQLKNI